MKRVDQILSYLAGEMEVEERRDFEKDLERDEELMQEYNQLSSAWKLVRDEIRDQDEAAFQAALEKAMSDTPAQEGISRSRKRLWWFIIPLAASMAILIATPLMRKDSVFPRFYHPDKDGIVQALGQESRTSVKNMAALYFLEAYEECYEQATMILEEESDNQMARLFLYLSASETGKEIQALKKGGYPVDPASSLDHAVIWYRTLLLVKTGNYSEAQAETDRLVGTGSPYAGDAYKLKRQLRK